MSKNKKKNISKFPFVSICTPTFNRRPFMPFIIKCFENQTYPKDRIEWIIIDDGSDKIEDLVSHIPQVKYFKYDEKMTLGKKRNLSHEMSSGEIIVNMDDDDYYPPDRIQHAVDTFKKNPNALCAGSSEMYIYFKHIQKMYQFGPYGKNHATAATFAFRRELLKQTRFDETACIAEEKKFLKDYTIPFVQLDPMKSILVFSHNHNSFDKKTLLENPNEFVKESTKKPYQFVKEPDVLQFFMNDIDELLNNYDPGHPKHKPDVNKQMEEITQRRIAIMNENIKKQKEYNDTINKISSVNNNNNATLEMSTVIQELTIENGQLKNKIQYLEDKISKLITEQIQYKKLNMQI